MKIRIYINDYDRKDDVINKVYEIVAKNTGQQPNVKVTNKTGLR